MDFEFTDDQLDLRDGARKVLESTCPPSLVRAVFEGASDGAELWRELVALDWPGLGLPEEHGGVGLGFLDVGILVEELGRVVAPSPFLATVTQLAPLVCEAGSTFLLDDIAAGRVTGSLAVAEAGQWRLDGLAATARPTAAGWVLDGVKTHVMDGARATEIGVIARAEDGLGAFVVPGESVEARPLATVDPTQPVATVTLAGVEVSGGRVLLEPGDPATEPAITRALEQATTAMALSTVATCRAIFEATLQYAKDREQFGKPIGSFQAVKHRLAECFLAVERASALSYFAALTIAEDDPRRAVATSMAKAAAGDCQRLLVKDGLQLHGGIGFTWENDLHFALKRAKAGDLLFGTAASHRAHLATLLGIAA
jgi:alkylation response protein AidB-like acyl-CoA dehydrogenase